VDHPGHRPGGGVGGGDDLRVDAVGEAVHHIGGDRRPMPTVGQRSSPGAEPVRYLPVHDDRRGITDFSRVWFNSPTGICQDINKMTDQPCHTEPGRFFFLDLFIGVCAGHRASSPDLASGSALTAGMPPESPGRPDRKKPKCRKDGKM
jgi:hypothetical protein